MGEAFGLGRVAPRFLVDSDLSPFIAPALRPFFVIETVEEALGRPDVDDEDIIPWLGVNRAIWITHDREAKRRHGEALKQNRVTVLWVRGDSLSNWEMLKIVVRVIDVLTEKVVKAHGAIHFRAGRSGGPTPTVEWAESRYDRPKGQS